MAQRRILVVEDEVLIAESIRGKLLGLGYEVPDPIAFGEEAVRRAEELQPDLVLMDIKLGGEMDGVKAAEQIRECLGVPVIYLTAYADAETLRRAGLTEPFGYLLKPLRMEDLRSTVELALHRQEVDEKLRREQDLTSAILDTAGALVVVLDTQARIVRFNRACERATGYSFDEVRGEPLWDRFLVPEDVEAVRAVFAQLRAGQFPNEHENYWLTKSGDRRWIAWSNTALVDDTGSVEYVIGTGIDITERKRAEEEIRKLSRAVEQSPSTVVITDTDGYIEYVNPAFTAVTGYTAEEVIGQNPRILKSGIQPPELYAELWATLDAGDEWRGELSNRRKDGHLYWELASISPIRNPDGTTTHFLKVAEDITERKEAEEVLRQRTLELQTRNEELDAFAHTVAHDLQNPLGLVIGYADLLASTHQDMTADELERCLDAISRNSHRLSTIVTELLILSSVRKADVEVVPLQMGGIVAGALERLAGLIEKHRAVIVPPSTWPVVLGHAPWIEEVWANYLSNAIKYGGQPPRIELGAEAQPDGMVRFWVRDNGDGLTPEEQAHLFVPFTRLAQVKVEGQGLGLSIVRRIVGKLGGKVGIESSRSPGRGSLFYFCLPAATKRSTTQS